MTKILFVLVALVVFILYLTKQKNLWGRIHQFISYKLPISNATCEKKGGSLHQMAISKNQLELANRINEMQEEIFSYNPTSSAVVSHMDVPIQPQQKNMDSEVQPKPSPTPTSTPATTEAVNSTQFIIGEKGKNCNETCENTNLVCSKTVMESDEMVGNPIAHSLMGSLLDNAIKNGTIKEKYSDDEKYSKGKRLRDDANIENDKFSTLPGLWMRTDNYNIAQVSWKDENSIPSSCSSSWNDMRRYCACVPAPPTTTPPATTQPATTQPSTSGTKTLIRGNWDGSKFVNDGHAWKNHGKFGWKNFEKFDVIKVDGETLSTHSSPTNFSFLSGYQEDNNQTKTQVVMIKVEKGMKIKFKVTDRHDLKHPKNNKWVLTGAINIYGVWDGNDVIIDMHHGTLSKDSPSYGTDKSSASNNNSSQRPGFSGDSGGFEFVQYLGSLNDRDSAKRTWIKPDHVNHHSKNETSENADEWTFDYDNYKANTKNSENFYKSDPPSYLAIGQQDYWAICSIEFL